MDEMLGFFDGREIFADSESAKALIGRLRTNFSEIDKFIAESIADYSLIDSLGSHEQSIVRQEHDAVEMALRIAGMVPRKSYRWSPTQQGKEEITSFFSGLKPEKFDEDDVVRWDADKIPGFNVISKEVFGHYILRDGSATLHTFHANKNALENTLGCDLIYFNEQHKSFAFIQYKMAELQGQTHIFRFPNSQLSEEIKRMDKLFEVVQADLAAQGRPPAASDFRMLNDPFFLKFCPRDAFDPDQNEQIKGMLIPISLWKIIENDTSGRFVGSLGGSLLSFENCPRYLDNTRFIALLQEGWFGTCSDSQELLESIITEIINSKRSVVLAARISALPDEVILPPLKKKRTTKKKVKRPAHRQRRSA